jgi:outer membrane lipopolysaccharide assembly protein LptE/RlpB
VFLVLASLLLTGCGGELPAPSGAPTAATADGALQATPQDVKALRCRLAPAADGPLGRRFVEELRRALERNGFNVVPDAAPSSDYTLRIAVDEVEEASLVRFTVSGRRKAKYDVSAKLWVVVDDFVHDSTITTFKTVSGEVDPQAAAPLLAVVAGSTALRRLARITKPTPTAIASTQPPTTTAPSVQPAPATPAPASSAPPVVAGARPATEWDAMLTECREPTSRTSCDRVKAWLKGDHAQRASTNLSLADAQEVAKAVRNGGSLGAILAARAAEDRRKGDEARQVLQAGEAKIKIIVANEAWAKVDAERCKQAEFEKDCADVMAFLRRFPYAPQASEAQAMLSQVGQRRVAKRQAELQAAAEDAEAQRKKEAAMQQKAAQDAQCRSGCAAYTDPEARSQCIAKNCK